jgi:EAL domain-containing protein (putative c-di-GMP-specific phosphodiesterase class I)
MINFTKNDVSIIMANGDYGVCYEPIVAVDDKSTIGYEALSRFKLKNSIIPPNIFFKTLHQDLDMFFHMESIMKSFQLEHRLDNKTLFLNLDPDVSLKDSQIDFWINLLKHQKNIVVEIIENSDEESVDDIRNFMDWMRINEIEYAYDDFGKPNSIFFQSLLETALYIKLDIHFIRTIRVDKSYGELLKGIVKYARLKNKYTILEGVETDNDFAVAKYLEVDYVQGYLFRDRFTTLWK